MKRGINTTQQQTMAVQNANKTHDWPDQISEPTENALSIYINGQSQRGFEDWPALDLIELARISRLIDLCDEETTKYVGEGVIAYGGKTGMVPVENPRGRAISTLNSTINSTLRRLGITSMSVGEKKNQSARGQLEREAERGLKNEHASRRSLI